MAIDLEALIRRRPVLVPVVVASAATFVASYLVFGPVRMGFPNQCHPQPSGEVLCTLMMLPARPESLLGLAHTWWVPVLATVVVAAIMAVWRSRSAQPMSRDGAVDESALTP